MQRENLACLFRLLCFYAKLAMEKMIAVLATIFIQASNFLHTVGLKAVSFQILRSIMKLVKSMANPNLSGGLV